MLKSPFAGGIAWGLGVSCLWLVPILFATVTGTGLNGFAGCTIFMLIVAAVIAEVRARKKAA